MLSKIAEEDRERTLRALEEYPIQMTLADPDVHPVVWNSYGVLHWEPDPLIRELASLEIINLNKAAIAGAVGKLSNLQQRQLAKRLGYSLSGYADLSYVQAYLDKVE